MTTKRIGSACKTALAVALTGGLFAGTAQAQLAGQVRRCERPANQQCT